MNDRRLRTAVQLVAGAGDKMHLQCSFYELKTSLLQTGHTCSIMHATKGLAVTTLFLDNEWKTADMVANMKVSKQKPFFSPKCRLSRISG
jgi:hypothetical protein